MKLSESHINNIETSNLIESTYDELTKEFLSNIKISMKDICEPATSIHSLKRFDEFIDATMELILPNSVLSRCVAQQLSSMRNSQFEHLLNPLHLAT